MSDKETTSTELAPSTGFGSLPALPQQSNVSEGAVPYLGFFSMKSSRAEEIKGSLPTIKDGEPYLGVGPLYVPVEDNPIVFCAVSPTYQVEFDTDFVTPTKVSLTKFDNSKEVIVVAGIALIGDTPHGFLATLRTTKCSPAKVAYATAAASEQAGWAKNKVQEALLKLPAMLRHAGVLTMTAKSGKFGTYHVARWNAQPLTVEQGKMIQEWMSTPEPAIIEQEFNKRVAEYNELIG